MSRSAASDRLWLITGPNMGGKSTFLRQAALIALLAQAGSYRPRRARHDRHRRPPVQPRRRRPTISRAGARPSWSRWSRPPRSSPRRRRSSLVILDEIGRGTSTYDGLAIAWAVVEAMHDQVRCRTLFATHYHELTRLADRLDALSLHHVRAREWKGDLVLLHEVAAGAGRPQLRHRGGQARRRAADGAGARQVGARQARGGARRDRRDCRRARRSAACSPAPPPRPSRRAIRSPTRSTRSTPTR